MAFKALVGSHNYNLADENSDKDYKMFVLPTFEDLYKGKMYSKQTIGETEDLDVHDIRKVVNLFYKSNINFIEVLFTNELHVNGALNSAQKDLIDRLFLMKDDIVRINLPYLFNACGGMYKQKMSLLHKGTEGTQHLVDKYGYDTKQALHAYRVLDFIVRFADTDFQDFKKAITYNEKEREFMMEIKGGFFDIKSFTNFITFYHDAKFKQLKDKYHSFEPNEKVKEEIESIIMELVRISIQK